MLFLVLVTDRFEVNVDYPVRYHARDTENARRKAERDFPDCTFKVRGPLFDHEGNRLCDENGKALKE